MTNTPNNVNTILHIGAGNGEELNDYLATSARYIILVEPNPVLADKLRQRTADDARVQVLELAVTATPEHNQFAEYNLPEANSLHRPSGLRSLYPGLRLANQYPVKAQSPAELFVSLSLPEDGENHLIIQAPGAELAIVQALAEGEYNLTRIQLTASREPLYEGTAGAGTLLESLRTTGYDAKAIEGGNPDWPQWQCTRNPLAQKLKALKTQNEALTKSLQQSQNEQQYLQAELDRAKAELEQAGKDFDAEQAETKQTLESLKAELSDRKTRVGELKGQLEHAKDESQERQKQLQAQKAKIEESADGAKKAEARAKELEQKYKTLQEQTEALKKEKENLNTKLKTLEERLTSQSSNQKELDELKKRMEYLFGQQSLQLEQAANALGRHVTTTAKTTAQELEAGIALQQQYGGDVPALESLNTKLPATVALALSRQLKTQPYDLIIEMGSGVTTSFMAHTLRSQNGQRSNSEKSNDTQVSRYVDPSEDDLPKRIVCFEHNRANYTKLQDTLKASGLVPLISLQFSPLVPYSHKGQEYLFYDCANRLQQIARLFEDRQARIFILVNQSGGESQADPLAALPQVLQYLSAHTLDMLVNTQGREGLAGQWQKLLEERGIDYEPAAAFGGGSMKKITVNP